MPCPCQLCSSPEATVHLTEVAPDGARQELHVCRACIARHGLRLDQDPPPVAELKALAARPAEDTAAPDPTCDTCGLALSSYVEANLFGCPSCYESFDQAVMALIERYHGATTHRGRRPAQAPAAPPPAAPKRPRSKAARRAALQRRLDAAVAAEQFEEAAKLRDALAALGDDP